MTHAEHLRDLARQNDGKHPHGAARLREIAERFVELETENRLLVDETNRLAQSLIFLESEMSIATDAVNAATAKLKTQDATIADLHAKLATAVADAVDPAALAALQAELTPVPPAPPAA